MNKQNIIQQLRRTFFALAIIGALLALPRAEAGPPVPASGSWTDCQNITDFRSVGRNLIITWDVTFNFTGTFTGTWVGTERDVIYPEGPYAATFTGSGLFTSSDNTGTVVMTYQGLASSDTEAIAYWVVDQGTGSLAGVHGHGTFQHIVETGPTDGCDDTFTGDYSGQIQFAP
jgi:hypothetical protein